MKLNRLFIVLAIGAGSLTLNSCSKSSSTTTSNLYMTADIDGTATTFNTHAIALTGSSNGESFTSITGTAKDGTTLSITIMGTVTAGKTYSDASANNDDKPLFLYVPPGSNADTYLNDDDNVSALPSITVSSVSSGSISGTFKGLVEGGIPVGNNNTLPTKTITNGKFSLSFTK